MCKTLRYCSIVVLGLAVPVDRWCECVNCEVPCVSTSLQKFCHTDHALKEHGEIAHPHGEKAGDHARARAIPVARGGLHVRPRFDGVKTQDACGITTSPSRDK